MLARIEMKLRCQDNLSYQMSSLFHGVLMERLSEEYGAYLHESRLHPYAQHLECRDREWYWIVNALNKEAVRNIIYEGLLPVDSITVKRRELELSLDRKKVDECTYRELTDQFYFLESRRYIEVHFITPTAFKQQGRYVFYPDLRCIYQSLMNKYDAAVKEESMCDEETLKELCRNSEIKHYDLKSTQFYLEGVRIPSFIGKITIRIGGTQTMTNFANLLFQFGTYSGVGIKTSLGMGAIKLLEKGESRRDRATDQTSCGKYAP